MLITELLNTPAQIVVTNNSKEAVTMSFILRGITYTFEAINDTWANDIGETWEVAFGIPKQNNKVEYSLTQTGNAFEVLAAVQQCCLKLIQLHPDIQQIVFTGDKGEASRTKLYDRLIKSLKIPGWTGSKEEGGFKDFYFFTRNHPQS